MDDFIARRVNFLIQAARHGDKQDLAVTWVLRSVWNYLATGDSNAKTDKLRKRARFRSKAAHDAICRNLRDVKFVVEHEWPLRDFWTWMCNDAAVLRPEQVVGAMQEWMPVVVTEDEDRKLKKVDREARHAGAKGLSQDGGPTGRYVNAGVEVLAQDDNKNWAPRLRRS